MYSGAVPRPSSVQALLLEAWTREAEDEKQRSREGGSLESSSGPIFVYAGAVPRHSFVQALVLGASTREAGDEKQRGRKF